MNPPFLTISLSGRRDIMAVNSRGGGFVATGSGDGDGRKPLRNEARDRNFLA